MAAAEHIPRELILDILSRLPAKSLGRFRCVNKLWCNSIVDSDFIQMHLHQAIQQDHTNLFFVGGQGNPRVPATHLVVGDSFDKCIQIENPIGAFLGVNGLGTCNGIICFVRKGVICLFNPCTREYKMMPFQKIDFPWYNHVCGLGYDGVNHQYILVILVRPFSGRIWEARVYSLNDTSLLNSWTLPYEFIFDERKGIYLNGFLHWVAFKDSRETPVIISFDNGEEKVFREMLTPPVNMCGGKYSKHITLGILRGQLCIFGHSVLSGNMELWVMQNYGVPGSLVKLLSVDIRFLPDPSNSRVLRFSENGKLVIKDGYHLLLYDPKQVKTWKITYSGVRQHNLDNWIAYVPSLVQLKSNTFASTVAGVEPSKKKKIRYRLAGIISTERDMMSSVSNDREDLDIFSASFGLPVVEYMSR